MNWDIPRLIITMSILLYFGYALMFRYTNGIEETLKSIVMLAVGYWLAKNDAQEKATENTGKAFDAIKVAAERTTGTMQVDAENVNVDQK